MSLQQARQCIVASTSQSFLTGFDDSEQSLREAVSLLAGFRDALTAHPPSQDQRTALRLQVEGVAKDVSRAQAIHAHAESLLAGWARLFTEATCSEPAQGYSSNGAVCLLSATPGSTFQCEG